MLKLAPEDRSQTLNCTIFLKQRKPIIMEILMISYESLPRPACWGEDAFLRETLCKADGFLAVLEMTEFFGIVPCAFEWCVSQKRRLTDKS